MQDKQQEGMTNVAPNSALTEPKELTLLPLAFTPIPCAQMVSTILGQAHAEKRFLGHKRINYAHIGLALVRSSGTALSDILKNGTDEFEKLSSLLSILATRINEDIWVDQVLDILQVAWNIAQRFHANRVEFNHMMLAVIFYGEDDFAKVWDEASKTSSSALTRELESCAFHMASQNSTMIPDFFIDIFKLNDLLNGAAIFGYSERPPVTDTDEITQNLSSSSKAIVALAAAYACEYNRQTIDVEVLIMALGTSNASKAWEVLRECGFVLIHLDFEPHKRGSARRCSKISLAPNVFQIMKNAIEIAQSEAENLVSPEHILKAIINECNGYAEHALALFDLDAAELNRVLHESK